MRTLSPILVFVRLRQEAKPIRFLISRVLWFSRLCTFFLIERSGYRLRFFPTALSATLWTYRDSRWEDERFFRAYLRPGDCLIDVGANIGSLTLAGANIVGITGRVIAIEPHPKTFSYLLENVRLTRARNVNCINVALGDQAGEVLFSDSRSDDQNCVLTEGEGRKVVMKRLDDLDLSVECVDLLKVDVEGYEKFVFEGGREVLRSTACVYFEHNPRLYARNGYSIRDVVDLLDHEGFAVFRLGGNLCLEPYACDDLNTRAENLIAIRDMASFNRRFLARGS